MPEPTAQEKQDRCFPGEFPDCGCHYTADDDGVHFCPMHHAAPELLDALLGLLIWECSPASAKAAPTKKEAAAYMGLIDAATKAIAKTK